MNVVLPHNSRLHQRLVVTADDFGLSFQVNDAVWSAHRSGILTAASLMVASPGAAHAVEMAKHMPTLRVGLHLVLIEAKPMLPPDEIPDLVAKTGLLRADMARLALDIALFPSVRRQLRAEITAQFAAFEATGLKLDHVNAHKHFHLHPVIGKMVIAMAKKYGAEYLRVPREDIRLISRLEDTRPSISHLISIPCAVWLSARARRAGLQTPDQVFGLAWSGAMTTERLLALAEHLPPGLTEIYTHPATEIDFEGAAPFYRYEEELDALTAPQVVAAFDATRVPRSGFSDLPLTTAL